MPLQDLREDATEFAGVGDIIFLKEADYLNGNGDIRVRLVHLPGELQTIRGLEWVRVIGVEVTTDREGPHRLFLTRVTALRTDRR